MNANLSSEQLEALLSGPALKPPPGTMPQLVNPPSYATTSIVVPVVCLATSTLAVAMRLYARIRILRQFGMADYSLVLGWAVFVAYIAMGLLACKYAPGVHQWDVRLRDLGPFLYYIHVGSVLYGICIFFIKLSILLQYIQIFIPVREPAVMYWTAIFLIGTNFVFYFTSSFLEIWACNPISKAWDPLATGGHCIDILALNVVASAINTVSDFAILILPQLVIWRLNTSWQHKSGISMVFLIAIFACVSSVIRLSYAERLRHSSDITYYSWFTGLWTLPEMASGIVVACLSVTRAFFVNLAQSHMVSGVTSFLTRLTGSTKLSSSGSAMHENSKSPKEKPSTDSAQGKSWMRAYGITHLTALSESESTRAEWPGEAHDEPPWETSTYGPTDVRWGSDVELYHIPRNPPQSR